MFCHCPSVHRQIYTHYDRRSQSGSVEIFMKTLISEMSFDQICDQTKIHIRSSYFQTFFRSELFLFSANYEIEPHKSKAITFL